MKGIESGLDIFRIFAFSHNENMEFNQITYRVL